MEKQVRVLGRGQRLVGALIVAALGLGLLSAFQNCTPVQLQDDAASTSATTSTTATSSTSYIVLSPSSATIAPSATYQFYASGGSGSYTYSVSPSTAGTITSSGYFVAGSSTGSATVIVTDTKGVSTSAYVTISTSSSSSSSSSSSISISPSSVTVTGGTAYQFTASGGSGSYTYSLSPSGYGSISSSGYFVAPSTAMTLVLNVTDASYGTVSYSIITVTASTTSTVLCSEAFNCGSIVGVPRELDGRSTWAGYNASALCRLKTGVSTSTASYETSTHSISCGQNYGLGQWNGSYFQHVELAICSQGSVTVLSKVTCTY